jgi:hypothetical protein
MSLPTADHRDFTADHRKSLSLPEVLIVEAIDLTVWIFTPAPWWIFRHVQASHRIITLRPVFLYCLWQLVLRFVVIGLVLTSSSSPLGVSLPLLLYQRGTMLKGR